MEISKKIFVAGARGLVGSAIVRQLKKLGYTNLLTPGREELDLTDSAAVENYFSEHKPEYVMLAAAKVGGIHANNEYPVEFLNVNLSIQNNVINSSYKHGVRKLLFLGSSCIYPKFAEQPMTEDCLLSGKLEPTNEAYAIAKIAGITLCQSYNREYSTDYICAMPTNLYGLGDNYHLENAHVLPALIHRFHLAKLAGDKQVTVWGSGSPKREFLFSDDLAAACIFLMNNYSGSDIVNIGCGHDISIKEVAQMVKEVVGFDGELVFDTSKPDGTPRKLLDVSRLSKLGWEAEVKLEEGLKIAYDEFSTKFNSGDFRN